MAYQDYVDHVVADGPLLYWPLQETSGSAVDESGNGFDGTVAAGGLWVPEAPHGCRGDKAFRVPAGSTGAAYLSYTGTLGTNAGTGLTVEFWLKLSAYVNALGYLLYADTGTNKFAVSMTSYPQLRVGTSGSTGRISDLTMLPDRWYYYAFTQDSAGSSRLYRNGELIGGPTSQTVGADFPDLKIGNGLSATPESTWTHVAVFNKVLTAGRIADRWAVEADDLYSFLGRDSMPFSLSTPVVVPDAGGRVRPLRWGQLWPRGDVTP